MSGTALIIVDIQNDFLLPSGSLAVPKGRNILELVYALLTDGRWKDLWSNVVVSQDWHPSGYISFASTHSQDPFKHFQVTDGNGAQYDQIMWPDHCIQGTNGAELEEGLKQRLKPFEQSGKLAVFRKGTNINIEAYSAFEATNMTTSLDINNVNDPDPDSETKVEFPPLSSGDSLLAKYLERNAVDRVVVVGLATDYCIHSTCISALTLPSPPILILLTQAIQGIDSKSSEKAIEDVKSKGGIVLDEVMGLNAVLKGLL